METQRSSMLLHARQIHLQTPCKFGQSCSTPDHFVYSSCLVPFFTMTFPVHAEAPLLPRRCAAMNTSVLVRKHTHKHTHTHTHTHRHTISNARCICSIKTPQNNKEPPPNRGIPCLIVLLLLFLTPNPTLTTPTRPHEGGGYTSLQSSVYLPCLQSAGPPVRWQS